MKVLLIFIAAVLFGAANYLAWHYAGFSAGVAGGASGGPAALLFFGLYRKYGKSGH